LKVSFIARERQARRAMSREHHVARLVLWMMGWLTYGCLMMQLVVDYADVTKVGCSRLSTLVADIGLGDNATPSALNIHHHDASPERTTLT
jgi:hypothetical protein